jgi:hypothetical protein
VRHEVLPLLETLDPRVVDHLCALADELGDARRAGDFCGESGGLARHTQLALAEFERGGRKTLRLELPRGVVASYERGSLTLDMTNPNAPRWQHRAAPSSGGPPFPECGVLRAPLGDGSGTAAPDADVGSSNAFAGACASAPISFPRETTSLPAVSHTPCERST